MKDYADFISGKSQLGTKDGFTPLWLPSFLFDFQKSLVEWSLLKGKSAIFADCGLGKTAMQLVWAQNVVEQTNQPVLILTPLAVAGQTVREGEKFGIECHQSRDGKFPSGAKAIITNYEKLHLFNAGDFSGCVCDESSILKNFDGATKAAITEFMRMMKYRLLCTATAAPNDYIELGTSSEAVGDLGYMDMLKMFFKADNDSYANGGGNGQRRFSKNPFGGKFRFRGHAEHDFWRWVCSWARAIRKPSDLGFDDGPFKLPQLITNQYTVKSSVIREGFLFDVAANTLQEQREERRRSLKDRCEQVAKLLNGTGKSAVAWCNLNDESKMLADLIDGAVEVTGSDSDEKKEESFAAFEKGEIRVIVSKAVIAGLGLNWQHCSHQSFFPSHSFEQYYQSVRRSWRFGQKNNVTVDVVTSEGESTILANLQRKTYAAEQMFGRLVELMNNELAIQSQNEFINKQELPSWL